MLPMIRPYYVNFFPETKKQALRNLKGINKYFSEEKLKSNEERIAIARFYMLYNKWEKALILLKPLQANPDFAVYAVHVTR